MADLAWAAASAGEAMPVSAGKREPEDFMEEHADLAGELPNVDDLDVAAAAAAAALDVFAPGQQRKHEPSESTSSEDDSSSEESEETSSSEEEEEVGEGRTKGGCKQGGCWISVTAAAGFIFTPTWVMRIYLGTFSSCRST